MPAQGPWSTVAKQKEGFSGSCPDLGPNLAFAGDICVCHSARSHLPTGHPIPLWGPPTLCASAPAAAGCPASSGVGQSEHSPAVVPGSGLTQHVIPSGTWSHA